MKTADIVFTLHAPDRPGIVKTLSDLVLADNGSWLESSLTRLCGQFTGIVHVRLPNENLASLLDNLAGCAAQDIHITVHDEALQHDASNASSRSAQHRVVVEANDREGIVDEIASALASHNINVEKLTSSCASASMAGYPLFKANIKVRLPSGVDLIKLEEILEGVSDDLMVSVKDELEDEQ